MSKEHHIKSFIKEMFEDVETINETCSLYFEIRNELQKEFDKTVDQLIEERR